MMNSQFTDDQLIHLSTLYISNPALRLSGYSFLQFASYPDECLRLLVFNDSAPDDDTEFLPPLPAQLTAAKKVRDRFQLQDAVASLRLDEDLQHDYPEAGLHGDTVTAPIHRRKPARRYKVGSHKTRQRRAVAG